MKTQGLLGKKSQQLHFSIRFLFLPNGNLNLCHELFLCSMSQKKALDSLQFGCDVYWRDRAHTVYTAVNEAANLVKGQDLQAGN